MTVTVGELKSALRTSTEKLVNASGRLRCADLKVTFRGKTAGAAYRIVNGNVYLSVNYPFMPDEARLSRGEADRQTGYAIHEVGHALFTDFAVFKAYAAKGHLHQTILNGIEDARMERCVIRSGWLGNARRCLEVLVSSLLVEALQGGYNPNDSSNLAFTLAILGREACGEQIIGIERVWALLNPKNKAWMQAAVAKIAKLPGGYEGTEAATRLADELIASLPQAPKQQQQPEQQPEQPDQPSEQQDDESDESGEGDAGDDEEQEPGEGDAGEEDADGEEQDGEGDGQATDDAEGEGEDAEGEGKGKPSDEQAEEEGEQPQQTGDGYSLDGAAQQRDPEVNGDMERLADKLTEGRKDSAADHLAQDYVMPVPHPRGSSGSADLFKQSVAKAGAFGAVKMKLSQMLTSPDEGGWEDRQTSGRFDARRVSAVKAGREDAFARRWEKVGYETAVLMMIDLSGSMGSGEGSRLDAAQTVACAFAECFHKLGVSFEAYGYTTGGGGSSAFGDEEAMHGDRVTKGGGHFYNRTNTHIAKFKGRDDSMEQARKTLSGINRTPGGGTPDYDAVRFAIETMMPLPHRRKVVFNITDGSGCGAQAMKSLVALGKTRGVDLIGIGIGRNANLAGQYELSATVGRASNLASECFGLLVRQFQKYSEKLGREVE